MATPDESQRVAGPRFSTPGVWLAVVTVTAAGVIGGVTPPGPPLASGTVAGIVGLGLVHALLGTVVIHVIERHGTRAQLYAHFVLALAVGGAVLVVSRGYAFLLLLSPISQSVLFLPTRAVVGFTAAYAAVAAAVYATDEASAFHAAQSLIGFASSVPFVVAFSQMLVRQRRAQAEVERLATELGEANARLRAYATEVEELATTKERNRIARDVHDGLGHFLTVVHVQLEAAQAMLGSDPDRAQVALAKAQALTHEGLNEVRRSVAALRGPTREDTPAASLIRELETLASECTADGLAAQVLLRGAPRPLAASIVFTLYRAAQEALTNVRRHAHASNLRIELAFPSPEVVRLRIEDDGIGADAPQGGFGLVGIRERAELCGGKVSIFSAHGHGFVLEVELPG